MRNRKKMHFSEKELFCISASTSISSTARITTKERKLKKYRDTNCTPNNDVYANATANTFRICAYKRRLEEKKNKTRKAFK